jgi:hypothetical protein
MDVEVDQVSPLIDVDGVLTIRLRSQGAERSLDLPLGPVGIVSPFEAETDAAAACRAQGHRWSNLDSDALAALLADVLWAGEVLRLADET